MFMLFRGMAFLSQVFKTHYIKQNMAHQTDKACSLLLFLGISGCYLGASKQWILIKEQGRNSDPSVRLLKSSTLACTTESIKPRTPGGAAAIHRIIH